MKRIKNILFPLLAAFILTSCIAKLNVVMDRFSAAPLCTGGLESLEYEKIARWEKNKKKFWIMTGGCVFEFRTGRSTFRAFELPPFEKPYEIRIKSYFVGDAPRAKNFYIFAPRVIFLDSNFNIRRTIEGDEFENVRSFLGYKRGLLARIPVREENRAERYMIIHTSDELLKKTTLLSVPLTVPVFLPGLAGAIPIGVDHINVRHAPEGKLKVELAPLSSEKGKEKGKGKK